MRILFLGLPAMAAIAVGSLFYPGQLTCYLLFSLTFFAILFSLLIFPFQYSHLFLAIPWFLGFWVKLVVHFAFGHFGLVDAARYVEPAGKFDGSAGAWDQVIITASIGGLGYLVGRLLLVPLVKRNDRQAGIEPPPWYRLLRTPLWVLAAVSLVAIVYINAETGLIVRGYVPRIQLPWPFGALFSWTTDIGFALVLSVMTAWDLRMGAGSTRGFFALCIEGAIISIQTGSRGIYLFHTIPALVSEARSPVAKRLTNRKYAPLLAIWLVGAVVIPVLTTAVRTLGQDGVLARTAKDDAREAPTSPILVPDEVAVPSAPIHSAKTRTSILSISPSYAIQNASRLVIDRWPGMEGLMAVVSYPARDWTLLKTAALQRRTYGMVDIYTHTIAGSDFTEKQAKKYHNATLAGPMAFFYYSGSWLVVFGGMALLAMLVSALELIWTSLVPDPLVTAMSGCYLALVVMQLSTGIVQGASGLFTVTALLTLVWGTMRLGAGSGKLLSEQPRDAA